MRSIERFGVFVLGVLLIGCGARGVQQQGQRPPMVDLGPVNASNVNIIVRCRGQQAEISLVPWRRALDGGGTVTFNLRGGPNTVSLVHIEPKPGASLNIWPFNGAALEVTTAQSVTTGPAPANNGQDDDVYTYTVRATCTFTAQGQNTKAGTRDVSLDPDLIVRGAGAGDSVAGTPAER